MAWEVVSLSRHLRSRKLLQGIVIVSTLLVTLSTASAQPGNPLGGTVETDGKPLALAVWQTASRQDTEKLEARQRPSR